MYAQFNAKTLYLITVFLFEAGSAICGASNTMNVLIFGRALCGFGGVGMYCGKSLRSQNFPIRRLMGVVRHAPGVYPTWHTP